MSMIGLKIGKTKWLCAAAICGWMTAAAALQAGAVNNGDSYRIGEKYVLGLAVKASPSIYAETVGMVSYPTIIKVDSYQGNWAHTTVDEITGWIDTDFCLPIDQAENSAEESFISESVGYLSGGGEDEVTLWSDHTRTSDAVGTMLGGTEFTTMLIWENWLFAQVGEDTGWVDMSQCYGAVGSALSAWYEEKASQEMDQTAQGYVVDEPPEA